MRSQGRVLVGILIVMVGLVFLLGAILGFDAGQLCLPTALIVVGVWLLLRPRLTGPDTALQGTLFGPVRREGAWQRSAEEIWMFVGDVRFDLTEAQIPAGETCIRVFGFVVDVKLVVPEGVGVAVSSTAFVSSVRILEKKRESIFLPAELASAGYDQCERKIRVEAFGFVSDTKVRPPAQ